MGIPWRYDGIDNEYRVHPRYKDLKEEMLHYRYLSRQESEATMLKANHYIRTIVAKSITSWVEPISIQH